MNISRVILFSLMLYAVSVVIFFGLQFFSGSPVLIAVPSLLSFVIWWIITIPLVLLLCKWYFKRVLPTIQNGVLLGLGAILVCACLDGLVVFGMWLGHQQIDIFHALFTEWKSYILVFEILLLTTYAGFEFDATDTPARAE